MVSARNTPGRTGRLADAMRDCCTFTSDRVEGDWWTLCPAHRAADEALRALWPSIRDEVRAAPDAVVAAVLSAAKLQDFGDLWNDAAAVVRFAEAWKVLA